MRICLTADFTNLPKCLSEDMVATFLRGAMKQASEKVIAGSRKAKVEVSLGDTPHPFSEPKPAVSGKKRGRKPKEVAAAAETFPVTDQPDPSDVAE